MAGETILVVEDEPSMLELLREILELAGYRVVTAVNGREGLAALERVGPQLVVSDIAMPRMDGYGFYAAVRAQPRWASMPFIFLSGKGDEREVREGKKLGVDEYLVKPVREEDLLVAVRSRLDRRAELEAAWEGQVEKLKRDILATLNHEFRTPLTWLAGYGELLRDSSPELNPKEFRLFLDAILAGAERLRRLVEDLVMLVDLHSDGARRAFDRQRGVLTDVPALLHEALARAQSRAEAAGVRLVADIPTELPPVIGRSDLLIQAVARLVDNGVKFSKKEGGQVTVIARVVDGLLRIQVRDEGIGIPREELDRISDMFYQVGRDKMEQQGCGAGLTIARGIVALHGGTLAVASEVGVGSTFAIELPTASEGDQGPAPRPS